MNKLKLLTAVAVAGLLGVSARASLPANYSSVNIHLTVQIQTNETTTASSFKFHVNQIKVTNKDILARVAAEFGDIYPAGAQLTILFGFWDDQFAVLDKTGAVLRANVSSGLSDSYELTIDQSGTRVETGGGNNTTETDHLTMPGDFFWSDATDVNELQVFGLTTVIDTFKSGNDPESFNLSNGVESGLLNDNNTLVTGSVSGKGANSNDF